MSTLTPFGTEPERLTSASFNTLRFAVQEHLRREGYDRIWVARTLCSLADVRVAEARVSREGQRMLMAHEATCLILWARLCAEDVGEVGWASTVTLNLALAMLPAHARPAAQWKGEILDFYEREDAEEVVEHIMALLPEAGLPSCKISTSGAGGGKFRKKATAHSHGLIAVLCITACTLMILRMV